MANNSISLDQLAEYIERRFEEYRAGLESTGRRRNPGKVAKLFSAIRILVISPQPTPEEGLPPFILGVFRRNTIGGKDFQGAACLLDTGGGKARYAVTAGHVIHSIPEQDLRIAAAGRSRSPSRIPRFSEATVIGNSYVNPGPGNPDLAVLKLAYGDNLPSAGVAIAGADELQCARERKDRAIVFGWGMRTPAWLSRFLRDTVMELQPGDDGTPRNFTCSNYLERGPCAGDSGGPLLLLCNGQPRLAGIVRGSKSRPTSNACHTAMNPYEYVSIPDCEQQIQDWIHEDAKPAR